MAVSDKGNEADESAECDSPRPTVEGSRCVAADIDTLVEVAIECDNNHHSVVDPAHADDGEYRQLGPIGDKIVSDVDDEFALPRRLPSSRDHRHGRVGYRPLWWIWCVWKSNTKDMAWCGREKSCSRDDAFVKETAAPTILRDWSLDRAGSNREGRLAISRCSPPSCLRLRQDRAEITETGSVRQLHVRFCQFSHIGNRPLTTMFSRVFPFVSRACAGPSIWRYLIQQVSGHGSRAVYSDHGLRDLGILRYRTVVGTSGSGVPRQESHHGAEERSWGFTGITSSRGSTSRTRKLGSVPLQVLSDTVWYVLCVLYYRVG